MKKLLCLLLVSIMIISVVACSTPQNDNKESESTDISSIDSGDDSAAVTEEAFVPSYTGVFKVGYDRQDISPDGDIYLKDGTHMTGVLDPIYATCIAVNDGENTALIFTIDIQNMVTGPYNNARDVISKATGVPKDNIVISTTHTHSAPQPAYPSNKSENMRWDVQFYNALQKAAKNAIADLTDAEIHVGATIAKDMSFVRRWFLSDGSPAGIWRQNYSNKDRVSYESDSDDVCQLIRFVREDKKDVLLTSWAIHFASAINSARSSVSADINAYLRPKVEELDDDVLFAFYLAPSGNIGLGPYVDGTGTYYHYGKMANDLAKMIVNEVKYFNVKVRKDTADVIAKAKAAEAEIGSMKIDSAECYAICAKYGFDSQKEVDSVIKRNRDTRGESDDIMLTTLSFGDIGFAGVPFEMFDTNGIEIREASPFKTTIVMTGCGGSYGYVPSALAVPNGGYEVYSSPWEFGTGELVAEALVEMLKAQK